MGYWIIVTIIIVIGIILGNILIHEDKSAKRNFFGIFFKFRKTIIIIIAILMILFNISFMFNRSGMSFIETPKNDGATQEKTDTSKDDDDKYDGDIYYSPGDGSVWQGEIPVLKDEVTVKELNNIYKYYKSQKSKLDDADKYKKYLTKHYKKIYFPVIDDLIYNKMRMDASRLLNRLEIRLRDINDNYNNDSEIADKYKDIY